MSLLAKASQEETQAPVVVEVTGEHCSTRNFPMFDASLPDIERFRSFLRSLDGRRKQESEVRQISADLNKILRFARPKAKDPVWLDILDGVIVRRYFYMLETRVLVGYRAS